MTFNPDESRDERGRWTVGGAGAVGGEDKRTLDVGGDKWNQDTAARLEKEYESQRDALDKLAHEGADKEVEISGPALNWESVSSDVQQSAEDKYIEDNLSSEVDHEIENWHESGGSLHDAASMLAEDKDWLHESLTDLIKDRDENEETRIPYSVDDLANAIKVESPEYDGYKDDEKKVGVDFDDAKLQHPDNQMNPDQLGLPGIDAPDPSESLTQKMRDDIEGWLSEKFVEKAKDEASNQEPPDYLSDSAKESLGESWSGMDDEDKYAWAQKNGVIDEEGSGESTGQVRMPSKFDPLNTTSGENYNATQSMAHYLSLERAAQLMRERGIKTPDEYGDPHGDKLARILESEHPLLGTAQIESGPGNEPTKVPTSDVPSREDIAQADFRMWSGWKDSSVGNDGKMIQVATHEELGGRLNTKHTDISKEASEAYADQSYKAIGGYEGVKAMLRAKWETTQYMLDKADMPMVKAYRGLSMNTEHERIEEVSHADAGTYKMLPDMPVARNGAASFSTDRGVSNKWKQSAERVVVRAEVPRTSVISVPAYGVNVHSEHEVVVMGTAWKAWDAWKTTAPSFTDIAIKPHVAKAPVEKKTKAEKEHVTLTNDTKVKAVVET